MSRPALLLAAAAALSGCGSDLDAKAEDSLDRLGERERAAAQVLVELEDATRDEDITALCRRIYVYDAPLSDCERAFAELLDRQRTMALEVEDVTRHDHSAIATATVTTIDNDGEKRTSDYTFRLLKRGDRWRVQPQE